LKDGGVEFLNFPEEVVTAMRGAWEEVKEELKGQNADVATVVESYDAFLGQAIAYSAAMTEPMLTGRA